MRRRPNFDPASIAVDWLPVRYAVLSICAAGLSCSSHPAPGSSAASSSTFALQVPAVTVAAGQEKFVCFAQTISEDLTIDRFDYSGVPGVHHVFFTRTIAPEPDGFSECNVLFKTTWIPLFVAGKGSDTLQVPPGAASILPKGTQLLTQLHLLNANASDETANVTINMHRSSDANPQPVSIYAFGTNRISIPPNGTSSVVNECVPKRDLTAFADFAHMHLLGTKLTFEQEDGTGAYQMMYARDPYDFNNQFIDQTPLPIAGGKSTRITCTYDNTTADTVAYGESTHDEMCFLVVFVTGGSQLEGCVGGLTDDAGAGGSADAGTCTPTPNSLGIGTACTAGGGQCPSGLSCTSDLSSSAPSSGYCIKVGCSANSDCGSDATCCSPPQAAGVKVCLPAACAPSTCGG